MDIKLTIIQMPVGWLHFRAISGIFSLHAGPIYSNGNLTKLPFLTIFNVINIYHDIWIWH